MAKELSEESKFQISVKTLISIVAATNTWPPTRMEFNMKDQMARNQINAIIKEVDEMKEEIKLLRQ